MPANAEGGPVSLVTMGSAFCRHCGSLAPRRRDPGGMQIPAGSLDADPGVKPAVNIFVSSKAPWSALDESIPCFAEYPE